MARGLNKVMLIGHIGRDPEIKAGASGVSWGSFSLATAESRKNSEGQYKDYTEWHKIVVLGKVADVVKQYCRKGSKLYVSGKLQTREWEKDGVKRQQTEIVADEVLMLDSKGGGGAAPATERAYPGRREQEQEQVREVAVYEDDIPF